jgi:hypothetical protein
MKHTMMHEGAAPQRHEDGDRLEFRALFTISFAVCLAFVSFQRIVNVFSARDGIPEGSVIAEAKSAAYAAVGYAFMGH